MLLLALDTSGDICSFCLAEGGRPRSVLHFRHERHLSERLPAQIAFLLRDAGASLSDIEAFAVGIGPGSFTGVRVGVTMAKTWAQVCERPLVGISSLDALAAPLRFLADTGIVAVAPARRDEVVAAYYPGGSEGAVEAPAVLPVGKVLSHAADLFADSGSIVVTGEVAALYPVFMAPGVRIHPAFVTADAVAALAAARLERGESDDPFMLTPLYVTPSPVG